MDKRDVPAPIPPAVEPPHRDSVNPPPHPWQEGPQGAAEGPETSRTVERAFTPPGAVPAAPKAPGSLTTNPPPNYPRDLWRDRLRVVWDRVVYLAVIAARYKLRMADKLDAVRSWFRG